MAKKKRCRRKSCGRKYTKADLASNRRNQPKREQTNKEARKRGIYGKRKRMGKDLSHGSDGSLKLEKTSTNRARNGKNGKSSLRKAKKGKKKKGRK